MGQRYSDNDFPTVVKCFFNYLIFFPINLYYNYYIIAYQDYYFLSYFGQVMPDFRPIFMQAALSTIAPLL